MITSWPKPERGREAVRQIIAEGRNEGILGHDSEFVPETLQGRILGVASKQRCAACEWDNELALDLLSSPKISAYSCLGADRPVIESMTGVKTPLSQWSDPMMKWYIRNSDLASVPKSTFTEDDAEGMGLGFMGLWACTSVITDLPNWKRCIGSPHCELSGRPCPIHNELDYCAVDSWAGLQDDYILSEQMSSQETSYYHWRMEVAEYCIEMQKKGIPVDEKFVADLEEMFNAKKASLFPYYIIDSKEVTKKCPNCKGKGIIKIGKGKKAIPNICPACHGTKVTLVTKNIKPKKTWVGPFNPNSPKAVVEYFDSKGITLRDRMGASAAGKDIVLAKLNKELAKYSVEFDPQTGELSGDIDEEVVFPEDLDLLLRLAQKQNAGKGLKSWFDSQYIVHHGDVAMVHPRFNPCGSSMSRLSSSKPNFQNVPRVGFGAEVRKACVALPGCKVVKADLSQLEFRACLWHAGVDPNAADGAFELLVEKSQGKFEKAAERLHWKPRDVAKSAIHAGDYMEGLSLRSKADLESPVALGDRKNGALLVYDGVDAPLWMFRGKFVCFTGSNLSQRLFGDRTRANRKAALEIQQIYMDVFPQIRDFQQKIAATVEAKPAKIVLPTGHFLRLYNRSDEDDLKQACACYGQGSGAIYAQEGMLNFKALGRQSALQVHDELVFFDIPKDWSPDRCAEFMMPMVQPSKWMPGFSCPAKVKIGPNWKEGEEWGTIRV